MADEIMNYPHKSERYISNYIAVPSLVERPLDPDLGGLVFAALCNRNAIGEVAELLPRLADADVALAAALAGASDEWQELAAGWSRRAPFATAPWWLSVVSMCRLRAGLTTTVMDLFAPFAHIWASISGDPMDGGGRPLLKARELVSGVRGGVKAVVASLASAGRIRDGAWRMDVRPTVQVPGSVNIGFALVPQVHDEGTAPASVQCALVAGSYMAAAVALSERGDDADLSAVLTDEGARIGFVRSFAKVRRSLSPHARLQLRATGSGTDATAVVTNPETGQRRTRTSREVELRGVVRAVDLDASTVVVRGQEDRRTVVKYRTGGLFTTDWEPLQHVDKEVRLLVRTTDAGDPPRKGDLLEDLAPPGDADRQAGA